MNKRHSVFLTVNEASIYHKEDTSKPLLKTPSQTHWCTRTALNSSDIFPVWCKCAQNKIKH